MLDTDINEFPSFLSDFTIIKEDPRVNEPHNYTSNGITHIVVSDQDQRFVLSDGEWIEKPF